MYEYSLPSHHWRLIPPQGDIPRPVYLHSAVQHGHDMIVFGGNSGRESNDLYTYNLDTFTWKREGAAGGFLSMGAAMPAARYGHASCVYGVNQHAGGSLLIVGGCKSNNTYFKDAWSMDLTSKRWKKLDDLPLDLAYHSLITWQERAYLFGGYNGKSFVQHMYVLDSVTGKWNILQVSGQSPPPMCGAATVLKGNDLYVFAGYTERGHTNELYRLNMATRVWSLLPTSNKPQARAYLQAAVIGDRCSVFGGYDGAHCISDFRCVTLPSPNGQSASSYPAHSLAQQQQAHPPVNIFTDAFFGQSTAVAADAVLQNFGGGYGEQLSKAQVLNMVAALQISWRQKASQMAQLQIAAAQSLAAQASVGGGQNYPFDTSKLGAIEALGFSKEHVLRAMAKMHAAGQNTKNIDRP